eukprot:3011126-Pyramimonas_sp.AAC.1
MSAFSSDAFAAYCPSRTCASPSSSSCTWGAIYQQAAEALASVVHFHRRRNLRHHTFTIRSRARD